MTTKELFREIGEIGDDLVDEAARELPKRRRWALPAACAAYAVLVAAGIWFGSGGLQGDVMEQPAGESDLGVQEDVIKQPTGKSDLPALNLGGDMWGGMGFEGVMAHDISEYYSGAPELPDELPETLPVFSNETQINLTNQGKDETPTQTQELFEAEISSGNASISNYSLQPLKVEFETAIALPEEYHGAEQSFEKMQALGEYLLKTYPRWFSWMENPQVNVQQGDYNIQGEQRYELHITDWGQDYEDALLGDAYRDMWLCLNTDDALWIIWVYQPHLSAVLGDYPIISADAARELLLQGNYATSVPFEMPGADAIRRVELCYRNDQTQVWLPYYRFWVEVPSYESIQSLGLNTYGAYYVPAVEGRYIVNMPTYDGGFN